MPVVQLGPFAGLQPRYGRTRKGNNYAEIAHDVDLSEATLRPWYENALLASTETHNGRYCGCEWRDIPECSTVTRHVGRCVEYVESGKTRATIGECAGERCDLQVPCPPKAVTASTPTVDHDRDTQQTQVMYTYFTANGYETSPSYPSDPLLVGNDSTIDVSGFVQPPESTCVDYYIIYALATGYRSGTEEQRETSSGWVEVARVPVGTLTAQVEYSNVATGTLNCTQHRTTSPNLLRDILPMGSGDRLIGHTQGCVYQSIPGEPHWWPTEFEVSLDERITLLTAAKRFALVFTDHGAYQVSQADSMAEKLSCPEVRELDTLPRPVRLRDSRGWLTDGQTIIYASEDGVVQVTESGEVVNLTESWLSKRDWLASSPETARLGYDGRHLFITTNDRTFLLTLKATDSERQLTTLTEKPERYIWSDTGTLLMLYNGGVYQFDAGAQAREGKWSITMNTGMMRLRWWKALADGTTDVHLNGVPNTVYDRCEATRLPKMRKSRKQHINLTTQCELHQLVLASSETEISRVNF